VVVIDEIGTLAECGAARTIAQRGVQLVATAHGNKLDNVIKNPSLAELVGPARAVPRAHPWLLHARAQLNLQSAVSCDLAVIRLSAAILM
jgi:stage III sporulation protein SpoIIIAA